MTEQPLPMDDRDQDEQLLDELAMLRQERDNLAAENEALHKELNRLHDFLERL